MMSKRQGNNGYFVLTGIGKNSFVFQDAYHIRIKVFSEEQGISKNNELDEYDDTAYHCVIYIGDIPIACARMNIIKDTAKICRIAVMKESRRCGYATLLCKHIISIAQQRGAKYAYLHAQTNISDLYRKIGFISEGETFIEEGIPHVRMIKKLSTS